LSPADAPLPGRPAAGAVAPAATIPLFRGADVTYARTRGSRPAPAWGGFANEQTVILRTRHLLEVHHDFKNPHTVADDHGDPDALLASLSAAESEADRIPEQLKAILAEALLR